jgi:hypothetical protein
MADWSGEGLGGPAPRSVDPRGYADIHQFIPPALPEPQPSDGLWPSRWSSLRGGALQAIAARISHAATAADDFATATLDQMKQGWRPNFVAVTPTGQVGLPIQLPPGLVNVTGNEDRHTLARATAPAVASLDAAARKALPARPNLGDKALTSIGHFGVALPFFLNPITAGTSAAIDGYGSTKQDALAHGATESDASAAAIGNGAAQGALAFLPTPGVKGAGAAIDKAGLHPLLAWGLKMSGTAGVAGIYAGASQVASNVAAKTYDPGRRLSDGVTNAVLTGTLFGAAVHSGGGILRAASLRRPRPRAISPRVTRPEGEPSPPPARAPLRRSALPLSGLDQKIFTEGLTEKEQRSNIVAPVPKPVVAGGLYGDLGGNSSSPDSHTGPSLPQDFSDLGPAADRTAADGNHDDLGAPTNKRVPKNTQSASGTSSSDLAESSVGEQRQGENESPYESIPEDEIYDISCRKLSPRECGSVMEYARLVNAHLAKHGPLTVMATAKFRGLAKKLIEQERRAAKARGAPYRGHVGHVPDMALTGLADPPGGWLDMEPRANATAGGGLARRIGKKIQRITVDGAVP